MNGTLIIAEGARRVQGPGGDVPGPRALLAEEVPSEKGQVPRNSRRERFDCKFAFRAHALGVLHRRFLRRQFDAMQAWAIYKACGRSQEDLMGYRAALRRLLQVQGVELKLIEGRWL